MTAFEASWPRFRFHVAGLTQADEIASMVSFLCRCEFPEGSDVIDGQALPDMLAAMRANAVLLSNNLSADLEPSSPSVCFGTAHPEWRLLARPVDTPVFITTCERAEFAGEPLHSGPPRLALKSSGTLPACELQCGHPFIVRGTAPHWWSGVFFGTAPDRVEALNVLTSEAFARAESGTVPSSTSDEHDSSAVLARFRFTGISTHETSIPLTTGCGTTGSVP